MHHEDTPNDIVVNHSSNEHLDQLVEARLSRRGALQAIAAGAMATVAGSACDSSANDAVAESTLDFTEVTHGQTPATLAPREYATQVVARWGDRVLPDAPKFDVKKQTADAQSQQFGYNCDFVAFMPLPLGSNNSKHGLLCVNHEYTDPHMMFPGLSSSDRVRKVTKDQVDVELAAHGHSVVEVIKLDGRWQLVPGHHNRRITASETEMRIAGPAAGHPRMRTSADPDGMAVIGTINNCAGGTTPWGTVLIAEENFQNYFGGVANDGDEARNCKRYGIAGSPSFGWSRFYDRFDVEKEPNEPNRFGWIVEFDPYDPKSVPVKRTALGRMRHEAATTVVAPNGRLVVYSGDDGRGEYFYKFVTREKYDPRRRAANANLLDDGTLYVAKFSADGTLEWLPLSFGVGPLTPKNDFNSQADVLIETRRAADLLGATKMDRPEDAETNPRNGRVYVMLTNNTKRKSDQTDAANPRAKNKHGHVLELIPPVAGGQVDHAADKFRWEMFLLAGDPSSEGGAKYNANVSDNGWLTCPDNCTFDSEGRLWIATDGAPKTAGMADGVYACDVDGPGRALTKHFFRGPRGAEICGPAFTPDGETLFLAIQHPGEGRLPDGRTESTFDYPSTRWPDFNPAMPPRPSVVAITRKDNGVIGT